MNKNIYASDKVNPSLCYGRDKLLQEMRDQLLVRAGFGIAGGRRMGKTTLLRRLEMDILANAEKWQASGLRVIPVYIDGLALPRPLTAATLWRYLLQTVQEVLPEYTPLPQTPDFDFFLFKKHLKTALSSIPDKLRLIVLFDEIEPILACGEWAGGFWANWRALLSNTPSLSEHISAVFAGAREMALLWHDITSPLANILTWRNLSALAFEDACRLMQEPLKYEWSNAFLETVYHETGGHPMLLQYVMYHVCSYELEKAEQTVEQAIATFAQQEKQQFSLWWSRYCSSDARLVYARLPDDGNLIPKLQLTREFGSTRVIEALKILQHVGLATNDKDNYRYSGEMFRRWYKEYGKHDLESVPRHDIELYDRLCKIDQNLGDRYLAAWRIYQDTELPNYSGAVAEMRDTITFLLRVVAPKDTVMKESGFKLKKGWQEPTRDQRVAYAVRQLYRSTAKESKEVTEKVTEVTSDFNLLEIKSQQLELLEKRLPKMVSSAYRTASEMVHETALREQAYQALKQWDAILAYLVPATEVENP